ncbi:MAG: ABC transporter ATP-binding protein [Taibaiella sp.]|nr:ABC transporter ATP-binding protein [Taibaiella sp.]
MSLSQIRIEEVRAYFRHQDYALAFRRLLDCAMDTQDMAIYKLAIKLTAEREQHKETIDPAWVAACLELLDQIATIPLQAGNTNEAVIAGEKLTKTYGHSGFSLGPISVQIRKGQVYGLVGENGNGKTTLLRILARELFYNQGKINYTFSKAPADDYDLRSKLVYIPQRTQKWYGSLKDNLKFVLANYGLQPQEIETRVLMMIARLGLWNYKDLKWHQLSSGYKMRFELARTLLRQPEVMLLDEPLANLDILAQQMILEDLRYISNSITNPIALILSSQQLYEVEKISDKVIFLKNGKYNHQEQEQQEQSERKLIVEMDVSSNKEQLQEVLSTLALEKLTFNGGQFIARFSDPVTFSQVLQTLGHSELEIVYIRNISSSSRRFFVA